ncbi:hypothetical protein [Botrimarina sp.]|uniref:TolB family protein n=1 Tax=Botrimarina sp. TaxID=2795802 RepID=UPI0032EDE7AF
MTSSLRDLKALPLLLLALAAARPSHAVRIATDPAPTSELGLAQIAITPDGGTIIANGVFDTSLSANSLDRIYSLAIPANPATGTAAVTQISTASFAVDQNYDTDNAPVISPDGQTILYTHDGVGGTNRVYRMPIAGEPLANQFTPFLTSGNNVVSPGNGATAPLYSPDGSTVYFLSSNAGFGGAVPSFAGSPTSFQPAPDWDVLYRASAAGGSPTAITSAAEGDLDLGFFDLTPDGSTIVYAPDNPVQRRTSRDNIRPNLFTIPAAGGTPTQIPLVAPAHDFTITNQLAAGPDGQSVLFIADYDQPGKQELYSLPLTGGVPMRLSDELPFGGDVTSFAVSPDGTSVAYAAGQNTSANTELFLKPISGASPSIRISDAPPVNSGVHDVRTSEGEGGQAVYQGSQVVFSPDGGSVYYLGSFDTPGVTDLYVVDTSEKTGLVPSTFTFTGPSGGDFFDETNWTDADGATAPAGTINPGAGILHSLLIDNTSVVASTGEIDFGIGGSLELTAGSSLSLPNPGSQLDFNPGSAFKVTDATVSSFGDIILEGTTVLNGGLLESIDDDIEFQDRVESSIVGTTFRSGDIFVFDQSVTSVTGATFESNDRLSLRFEVDFVVVDSDINVEGGLGDIEDAFAGAQGEGSRVVLRGSSTLLADTLEDGVDLVLEGESRASMIDSGPVGGASQLVDQSNGVSQVIFNSLGAELTLRNDAAFDPRAFIINGLTGLSYLDDPSAWTVADWNGLTPLASLRLASVVSLAGDYNSDGVVDAPDYTVWRDALGTGATLPNDVTPGSVTQSDYDVWSGAYGSSSAAAAPEPAAVLMVLACALAGVRRPAPPRRRY